MDEILKHLMETAGAIWMLGPLAIAGIGAAASAGMGLLSGSTQHKRNKEMQDRQEASNKRMLDLQAQKEYEMWLKTGAVGQMEQYKKAGLNPALMYGMGGGGGSTTGGSAGMVGGSSGSPGIEGSGAMMGMGLQMAMLQAQKENIEADTAKKKVEAEKAGGVDTEKAKTEIKSLSQGIENLKVKAELDRVETMLKGLDVKYQGESMQDRLQKISGEAVQAVQEGQQAVNDTTVSNATQQDKIKQIKAEAIGAVLRNIQTKAQTENTQTGTMLGRQALSQNIEKLMIDWRELSNRERKLALEQMIGIGNDDALQKTMNTVMDAIDNIMFMKMLPGTGGNYKKAPF